VSVTCVSELIPDRQWFNALTARPLPRWRHIPNNIILHTCSSDPWNWSDPK